MKPSDAGCGERSEPHRSRLVAASVAIDAVRAAQGIEKVLAACRAANLPAPSVQFDGAGLLVEFRFAAKVACEVAGEVGTGEKTGEKTSGKILGHLRTHPQATMTELAQTLGLSRNGVEWQIRKLKRDGNLVRIGPDKGGRWEVLP